MSKHFEYVPQIDALRALAVLIVLFSHYLRDAAISNMHYFGRFGVDLFFVISGFLLTAILVKQKAKNIPKITILKGFFVKRSLRLWPAYFGFLVFLLILSYLTGFWVSKPNDLWYYFTYTINFNFFWEGYKSPSLNHIWSLCVEEQFYLFLPFVILFFNRRLQIIICSVLFFLSPFILTLYPQAIQRVMVYSNLHTLCGGVLLAIMYKTKYMRFSIQYASIFFFISLIVALISYMRPNIFIYETSVALACMFLLLWAVNGFPESISRLCNHNMVLYIGKISYGLYLYHRFLPHFLKPIMRRLDLNLPPIVLLTLFFILVGGMSVISFEYYEKFFLKLKRKFDY